MKIHSAPKDFKNTKLVDEKIKKHCRIKEVIHFLKGHFHADIKNLSYHHGKAEVTLELHSTKGTERIVIGMHKEKAKPKKNNMKVLVIIVGVAVLIGGVFLLMKSSSAITTTTTKGTETSNTGLSGILSGLNLSGLSIGMI